MGGEFTIIKGTGEVEEFSEYKFNHSLKQAGVTKEMRQELLELVKNDLKKVINTEDLHQKIYAYLHHHDLASAARYNLRQAIMQLGPTGFPFESYFAEILTAHGYNCRINQFVHGHCARHEIDIVAHKDNVRYLIECKYHNQRGTRSDIKTALYIWARFEDVSEAWEANKRIEEKFHKVWLVTNTKVTTDAENYAKCRGLNVISWYRPYRNSLKDMIVNTGLWPITCLDSLPIEMKMELIKRNIVMCKSLINADKVILAGLDYKIIKAAQEEAEYVCQVPNIEVEDGKN